MTELSVVLDLDGTMIDTAPDLVAATNYTLGAFGMAPVDEKIIEPAVGLGSKAMLHAAMLSEGREPSKDELQTMSRCFVDHYSEHIALRSKPFPGLVDALEVLQANNVRLGVCTNKLGDLARKLLAELQLDRYFAVIAGADAYPVRKPDPGHILSTIQDMGGDAGRAVMIGDSSADSKAAQAAKVPFVAVTFGYGEKPVELLKPDAVIGHFHELVPTLNRLALL